MSRIQFTLLNSRMLTKRIPENAGSFIIGIKCDRAKNASEKSQHDLLVGTPFMHKEHTEDRSCQKHISIGDLLPCSSEAGYNIP